MSSQELIGPVIPENLTRKRKPPGPPPGPPPPLSDSEDEYDPAKGLCNSNAGLNLTQEKSGIPEILVIFVCLQYAFFVCLQYAF